MEILKRLKKLIIVGIVSLMMIGINNVVYGVLGNPISMSNKGNLEAIWEITLEGKKWFCRQKHATLISTWKENKLYYYREVNSDDLVTINKKNNPDLRYISYIFSFFKGNGNTEEIDNEGNANVVKHNIIGEPLREIDENEEIYTGEDNIITGRDKRAALQKVLWNTSEHTKITTGIANTVLNIGTARPMFAEGSQIDTMMNKMAEIEVLYNKLNEVWKDNDKWDIKYECEMICTKVYDDYNKWNYWYEYSIKDNPKYTVSNDTAQNDINEIKLKIEEINKINMTGEKDLAYLDLLQERIKQLKKGVDEIERFINKKHKIEKEEVNGTYYVENKFWEKSKEKIGEYIKQEIENVGKKSLTDIYNGIITEGIFKESAEQEYLALRYKREGIEYQNYIETLEKDGFTKGYTREGSKNIVNDKENKYIITPTYKVNYTHCYIDKSIFANDQTILLAGIEDIIVYNAVTGERIENCLFISEDENNIEEYGEVINNRSYDWPRSDENFHVQIPYEENLTDIRIEVKFKYLGDITTKFNIAYFEAYIECTHYSDNGELEHPDGDLTLEEGVVQDLLDYVGASWKWERDELVITESIETDPTWNLEISKRDAETENFINGAVFKVAIYNRTTSEKLHEECHIVDDGKISIRDLKATGKKINYKYVTKNGQEVKEVIEEDSTDVIEVEIEEISPAENYELDETFKNKSITLTLKNGKIESYVFAGGKIYDEYGTEDHAYLITQNSVGIQIYNERIKKDEFTLHIVKVSEDKEDNFWTTTLEGAKFDVTIYDSNNDAVFEGTDLETNENGDIIIRKKLNSNEKYIAIIKETKAPSGYKIKYYATLIEFKMDEDGYIEFDDGYDDIVMKRKQYSGDSYATVSNLEKEEHIAITRGIDSDRNLKYSELTIYIENKEDDILPQPEYKKEGYDIVIDKDVLNSETDEITNLPDGESIKFKVELKEQGTNRKVKNFGTIETINGEISLTGLTYTGNLYLEIQEVLEGNQIAVKDNEGNLVAGHEIIGEKTKIVKFSATSVKKIVGRTTTTHYYINKYDKLSEDNIKTKGIFSQGNNTTIVTKNSQKIKGIKQLSITVLNKTPGSIKTSIQVEGTVFMDMVNPKTTTRDNLYNAGEVGDLPAKGVKVTLLYADGDDAEDRVTVKADGRSTLQNPTYTDENGKYSFESLNPMRKYKVQFTYNGQDYMAVDKFNGSISSDKIDAYYDGKITETKWAQYSKASELDRDKVNKRFETIDAFKNSYAGKNGENIAYSSDEIEELYEIIYDNIIRNNGDRSILEDIDGLCEYLIQNGLAKDETLYDIAEEQDADNADRLGYESVKTQLTNAGIQNIDMYTVLSKLKYIEDCKVTAETDVYPSLDTFLVDDGVENRNIVVYYNDGNQLIRNDNVEFKSLYGKDGSKNGGTKQLNFGIYKRPTLELHLDEDIYNIKVSINNKTTVYDVDKDGISKNIPVYASDDYSNREKIVDNQADYRSYYPEMRKADYETNNDGNDATDLDINVTYKIELKNSHNSNAKINQLINHYDSQYFEYVSAYVGDANGLRSQQATISEDMTALSNANLDYYRMLKGDRYQQIIFTLQNNSTLNSSSEYVYITFKLKAKDGSTSSALRSLLADDNTSHIEQTELLEEGEYSKTPLRNYTEIYSYSTFGSQAETGLVDCESIVGNFIPGTGICENDDHNATNLVFKKESPRTLSGNVFEDTTVIDSSEIKESTNAVEKGSNQGIKGIKVELVEIKDGVEYTASIYDDDKKEYVEAETRTDENRRL